jgi:hypothetical protein
LLAVFLVVADLTGSLIADDELEAVGRGGRACVRVAWAQ